MNVNGFSMTALLLVLLGARTVNAHRQDYIDETLVFQTVEKGVIEPEYGSITAIVGIATNTSRGIISPSSTV
jgi:hypothetical protein